MNIEQKIHPTKVVGVDPTAELGKAIIALRYDLALPIFEGMIVEAKRQAVGDEGRGRIKLASELRVLTSSLETAEESLKKIIAICSSHIEREKENNKK